VVALVDGDLTRRPMHRVQLVGNHEARYLRDPVFDWPERISARSRGRPAPLVGRRRSGDASGPPTTLPMTWPG
jgi:hypothetical protein